MEGEHLLRIYLYVSFVVYSFWNWNKSTTTYLIPWLCAALFSSGFALVASCTIKRIVRDRRVWPILCSISVQRDVD